MNNLNVPQWINQNLTIRDIYYGVENKLYDLNPEHQRHVVHNTDWKCDIIKTVFSTGLLPTTYWHPVQNVEIGQIFESIDGKQRISALIEFKQDKFKCNINDTGDKLYSELGLPYRNHFDNFNLTIGKCSRELTDEEKHRSFEKLQITKTTTLGEVLNSTPNREFKKCIQEMIKELKEKIINKKFMEKNNRYQQLEIIAWSFYYYKHTTNYTLERCDITNFWNKYNILEEEDFNNYKKLFNVFINIIINKEHKFNRINSKTVIIPLFHIILKKKDEAEEDINNFITDNYEQIIKCLEKKVNASHTACKERITEINRILEL